MSRFHSLTIARLEKETRDAVAITFAVPDALRDEFRYEPGQHLTLKADIGGRDVRRSYSICSGRDDGVLRIAVKRAPGGVFSTFANESLKAGDTIEVMAPMGHFNAPLDPSARHHYVGFAAGSGITPLLSIVKSTLASEPRSHFTLFYGNRASGTVMFREELAALKDRHLDRFNLVHVLSREAQDIELLHGRIDRARADALLDRWVPLGEVDAVFVCGPEGMMDAVTAALEARGYPASKVKIERFAASIPKHEHQPARVPPEGNAQTEVTVVIDGVRKSYTLDRTRENLLDAALANGIELPYSCKGGVCSPCRSRPVDAEIYTHFLLAPQDYGIASACLLACQSYPATDKVVVDFDQTGMG